MQLAVNPPVPWDMTPEEMNAEIERHIREKNKFIGHEWVVPTDTKWFGVKNRLITEDLIRNYCNCVGDLNPLFRDETYARNTRWGGIIAPPMILHYVAMLSAGIGLEPPEVPERGGRLRIHGAGGLNVGGVVEFYEPVRPGDKFVCVDKFLGIDEVTKPDKPVPRLLRSMGQRKFINQHGKVVAAASGVELAMIPEKPLKKGEKKIALGHRFPEPFNHYYSEEEIARIDEIMYAEEIRGSKPRYWEDVNEGDPLVPVIKGPLTVTDIAAGMAFRGFLPAMEIRRRVDKSDDTYSNVDPRTGDMFGEYRCHVEDHLAQMYGEPNAFATGTQFMEWVCHITTNWMGDDAFLKRLKCRNRRMLPVGDTCTVTGTVGRKYREGDEYLVDLEITGTNWFGHTIFTATTTVALLSRDSASWGKYMFASR
jgi:acyl dehydratase